MFHLLRALPRRCVSDRNNAPAGAGGHHGRTLSTVAITRDGWIADAFIDDFDRPKQVLSASSPPEFALAGSLQWQELAPSSLWSVTPHVANPFQSTSDAVGLGPRN